jgi:Ca2+-binding EF-hand superfamily protein
MEPLNKEQIANIFKEIDQDHDGFITRQDLASSDYAVSLFENNPSALGVSSL